MKSRLFFGAVAASLTGGTAVVYREDIASAFRCTSTPPRACCGPVSWGNRIRFPRAGPDFLPHRIDSRINGGLRFAGESW